jgi:hypothetical protein
VISFKPRFHYSSVNVSPVPSGQEAGWAAVPLWTLYRTETSIGSAGIRNPVVQPVACRYINWVIPAPMRNKYYIF